MNFETLRMSKPRPLALQGGHLGRHSGGLEYLS